ncbi:MAG TPA: hypothetical protein VFR86_11665 [Burkholderiaceae bacterium]|nr:hypothetical protein [Burkholderiaceae bacterium]
MAREKRRFIAASDLAQLAYCEQKAVFEKRLGVRRTADQARAADSGTSAHARFLADGLLAASEPARDRRCFIATAASRWVRDRPFPAGHLLSFELRGPMTGTDWLQPFELGAECRRLPRPVGESSPGGGPLYLET